MNIQCVKQYEADNNLLWILTVVIQRASGSVIVGIMGHTPEHRFYFVGNDLLTNAGK